MKFKVTSGDISAQNTSCLVLGVFSNKLHSDQLSAFDEQLEGAYGEAVKSREFSARKGQTLLLHGGARLACRRLLLVGLGKQNELTLTALRQMGSRAAQLIKDKQLDRFAFVLPDLPKRLGGLSEAAQAVAEGILLSDYEYRAYLPANQPERPASLQQVVLVVDDQADRTAARRGISTAEAVCAGVTMARNLVNAPGNQKSPEYLAKEAVAMAEREGLDAHLLDRRELEDQGFGALLGVARGSQRDPYLIVLEYRGGAADAAPLALVGKGVVFDSGGISLKPAEKMDEMKMDMGGSAAVIGAMLAAARLKLSLNLVAVVPAVENMPSGSAIRPGDILTSLSGKTIEVLNTDAEGRLILADALTYVGRYQPRAVIDLATLTGACYIALGNQAAGLLGNHRGLIRQLLAAGERSGERLWELPLWPEYAEQIKSDFADIKNTGGRPAGAITAAAFLQSFAEKYRWAHLDIAGMAWETQGKAGQPKGGTGFGVRVLVDYLRAQQD